MSPLALKRGLSTVDNIYRVWSTRKFMKCFLESKCLSVMVCTNLHLMLNLTRKQSFTELSLHLLHPTCCFQMQKAFFSFSKIQRRQVSEESIPAQGWIQSSALDSVNNGCPWTHCLQDEWNIFHPLFASVLGTSANYEKLKKLELAKNC